MPLIVAPIAGALSDRIGGRMLMAIGLAMQSIALAMLAALASPTVSYSELIGPFMIAGIGMGLFFAPVANVVLGSVRPEEEGQASGANNAIRELGGVLGVSVLATVFAQYGSYQSPQSYVDGLTPAVYVGAGIAALGAIAALFIRRTRPQEAPATQAAEPLGEPSFESA